ncbi:MAG: hypothetical protein BAJALOKI1v1_230007 [Promethearchaeota archaeon]|nr:MAG: hypothetical protein BAJALOKI1v1_230007 [Candidatus Lokiarchaeota archaeon]
MLDQINLPWQQVFQLDILWLIGAIIAMAIFIAIWILIVQWIYKDAVDKGLNAEIWLLIVLITPIVSWVVYFIVRNYKARA